MHATQTSTRWSRPSRRALLVVFAAAAGAGGIFLGLPIRARSLLSRWTRLPAFDATPPLVPHDPARERRTVWVAREGSPARSVDAVLAKLGGIRRVVGRDDVVLLKVSAQWWNQGMTNVAAVRRVIEHILDVPGFAGEVVVFENTHFRRRDGSGLSRAWVRPSDRNVDVAGWSRLGDLMPHFERTKAPVSFVGLVDAGPSALSDDAWGDPGHAFGTYGGDGRGPIAPGEERDGYRWDFAAAFRKRRSLVDFAQSPLTWPVFTSPRSGLTVDLRDGIFRRDGRDRAPVNRKLTFITMPTANEHAATGLTCCCKSAMGIVDMSAGFLGTDPRGRGYQSVHYFGHPGALWRMAGPLAYFARCVRAPDLYLVSAEWVGVTPRNALPPRGNPRLDGRAAHRAGTVVAGTDPVALDWWCAKRLLAPLGGANASLYDVEDPDSQLSRFLRYYREVYGGGTLDPRLIHEA